MLAISVMHYSRYAVKILQEIAELIKYRDSDGVTVLHHAAFNENYELGYFMLNMAVMLMPLPKNGKSLQLA
jgi:ankyrin repeat protein